MPIKSEEIFDKNALRVTLGESDHEVLVSFYDIFLNHTTLSWKNADLAARKGNWQEVSDFAHTIKSSARSIGAFALADIMAEVEHIGSAGSEAIDQMGQASIILQQTIEAIELEISRLQEEAPKERPVS